MGIIRPKSVAQILDEALSDVRYESDTLSSGMTLKGTPYTLPQVGGSPPPTIWPQVERLHPSIGIRWEHRGTRGKKFYGITTRVLRSMIYWNLMYGFQVVWVIGSRQTHTDAVRALRRETPMVRGLYPEVDSVNPAVENARQRIFICRGHDLLERSVFRSNSAQVESRAQQLSCLLELMSVISIETAAMRGPGDFVQTLTFGPQGEMPTLLYIDPSSVTCIYDLVKGERYFGDSDSSSATFGGVSGGTMSRLSEAIASAQLAFSPGSTDSLPDLGVWT